MLSLFIIVAVDTKPSVLTMLFNKKAVVFVITYISYGLYHVARKNLSGVKESIMDTWEDNTTHVPLFISHVDAEEFLGFLDATFMLAYTIGLFFWGWLGDRANPKHVIVIGMIGSAIMLISFGCLPKWLHFLNIAYYMIIYFLFGFMQGCGWPSEVAIMANWFGSDNRGFIMGLWGSCQPLGNICGSLFTALIIPYGVEYTFFFIALMLFVGAIVVMLSIDPSPSTMNQSELEETRRIRSRSEQRRPISIGKAFLLPGVLAFCLCNMCLKLVNYSFFFWLPLYLMENYHWNEPEANRLSIWYDIGGIAGSVAGGYLSDKMGCRAPVIFVMLISSIGSLLLYILAGSNKIWNAFMMAVVGVTVSGPYYLIVGAISIDLGSQPALSSNKQAMSTVSGLLDGTGSAGSAIGQIFIPYVQKAFGWSSIFYLFMALVSIVDFPIFGRFEKYQCLLVS